MFLLAKGEKLRGWKHFNGELKISISAVKELTLSFCKMKLNLILIQRNMGTVRTRFEENILVMVRICYLLY